LQQLINHKGREAKGQLVVFKFIQLITDPV
jgi:hypothetical protein